MQLESNLDSLIKTKLDEKLEAITSFRESFINEQSVTISKISESYSDRVNKSSPQLADFCRIIQEAKNEELLQQREREVLAQNIIIHGFPEATKVTEGGEENINHANELLNILQVVQLLNQLHGLENAMK